MGTTKGKAAMLEKTDGLDNDQKPQPVNSGKGADVKDEGTTLTEPLSKAGKADVAQETQPETAEKPAETDDGAPGSASSVPQAHAGAANGGARGTNTSTCRPPALPNKIHMPSDKAFAKFAAMLESLEERKHKLAQQLYNNRDQWRAQNHAYQEATVAGDDKGMQAAQEAMEELDKAYRYLELQQQAFANADQAGHQPDAVKKLAQAANQECNDEMAKLAQQWAQAMACVRHLKELYTEAVETLHGISVQTRKVHQRYTACREVLGKRTGWLDDPAGVVHTNTLKGPIFWHNHQIAQLFKTGTFKD